VLAVSALGVALLASACAQVDRSGVISADSSGEHLTQPYAAGTPEASKEPSSPDLRPVSVPTNAPGPAAAALVGAIPPSTPEPVHRPDSTANRGGERTGATSSADRSTRPSTRTSGDATDGSGFTASDVGFASMLFSAVNGQRASRGLKALNSSACAQRHAQRWAERLASAGTFAHQSLGPVLDGCGAMSAGENIARGTASVGDTVSAWMGSAGHRANVLDSEFTHAGMATVRMSDGRRVSVHVFLTF
jgi:uncharacterized protein YkwD